MGRTVRKFKMSWKISIAMVLMAILVGGLVGLISIKRMNNYLLEMSKGYTASVAQMAAEFVDPEVMVSLQPGDEDTQDYMDTVMELRSFLMNEDLEYIYTMRKNADGDVEFVVDADEEEPGAIGEEYETYEEIEEAFSGKVAIDSEFTVDEWGTAYTGYAPIFNEEGNVVAIVGVDCSVDSIENRVSAMEKTLLVIELICLILALLVAMVIGKLMAKNVHTINHKMDELANSDGDLTQQLQITSGDEIENVANSFNAFMRKLHSMMTSVKENEENLENATSIINQEMEAATLDLQNITRTLSDMTMSMHDTSRAVGEITENTVAVKGFTNRLHDDTVNGASNAQRISRNADTARQTCLDSQNRMKQVVENIAETVESKIEATERIQKIVALTNDIISISEQTQLLALNASIEAARAGEEGKGFAVVADEIGKLADATAGTAQEIVDINNFTVAAVSELVEVSREMIEFIQSDVNRDYDTMVDVGAAYAKDSQEFEQQMKGFQLLSNQLKENMNQIEDSIGRIMAVVEEETASITSVSETAEEIHDRMQTIAANSEGNAEIVSRLGEVIDKFTL